MAKESKASGARSSAILYTTPNNHSYFCPTPGKITLLAITPNKVGSIPTDESLYRELYECGFNAASISIGSITQSQVNDRSSLAHTMDYAKSNGIALYIYSATLDTKTTLRTNIVEFFSSNNNLAGWSLQLPLYSNIQIPEYDDQTQEEDSATSYNDIWNTIRGKNRDSEQMVIMNAHPNAESARADNYRDYIIRFQDNIAPALWGTSVNPAGISTGGASFNNYDLFFRDLEIMALVSKYCERPFWWFVMCQSYMNASGSSTPYPSIEEMRFSAFSALAYGAQGLEFWSYRLRENEVLNGVTQVTYLAAPVDRDGNIETDIWNAVKTLNQEITALNEVFFGSYLVGVRHTGTTQYDATSMLKGVFGPLASLTSESAGVLVSHLNTNGQDYLVIVNHSFMDGDTAYQGIVLEFSEEFSVKKLSVNRGSVVTTAVSSGKHQERLLRGEYLIYSWS